MALAGPMAVQPAPQPLTLLDVPYISQSEALCGGARMEFDESEKDTLRTWVSGGLATR